MIGARSPRPGLQCSSSIASFTEAVAAASSRTAAARHDGGGLPELRSRLRAQINLFPTGVLRRLASFVATVRRVL